MKLAIACGSAASHFALAGGADVDRDRVAAAVVQRVARARRPWRRCARRPRPAPSRTTSRSGTRRARHREGRPLHRRRLRLRRGREAARRRIMAMPASAPAGRPLKERDPDRSRRRGRAARRTAAGAAAARCCSRRRRRRARLPDQRIRYGVNSSRDSQVPVPILPSTGRPRSSWKERTAAKVSLPKTPVTGTSSAGADQALLGPDDQVALAAALQQRVRRPRAVAGERSRGAVGAERPPLRSARSPASSTSSGRGRRSWRRSGGTASAAPLPGAS